MPDAFDALYEPVRAETPDPAFAARLRGRLERALDPTRKVFWMTADTQTRPEPAAEEKPPERVVAAAVPYLAVAGARAAIDWYVDVFGAELAYDPIEMDDGRIGHADLVIGGGHLYLADEFPDIGVAAPRPGEASVSLMLPVDDADAVRERAMAAGATGDRPPYDGYGSRNAWIVDPFGHRWGLNSPLRGTTVQPGDVVHLALVTPDTDATRTFYTDVLGWTFGADGRVENSLPSVGFRDGEPRIQVDAAVPDLAAALDRVRTAGGLPGEIERHPWGTVAECVDDQGTVFRLHELPISAPGRLPRTAGVTLEVVDAELTRAFYGTVLGWRFDAAGDLIGTTSMLRLEGGHERAAAVPTWRTDDATAAAARVRDAGGTGDGDGGGREWTDPQGLRFRLSN